MRASKGQPTQKERSCENICCFNLQSCARVARAWRARREKERTTKEGDTGWAGFATGWKPTGAGNQTGAAKSGQVSEKRKPRTITQETSHVENAIKNIYHGLFGKPTGAGKPAETGKAAAAGKSTSAGKASTK